MNKKHYLTNIFTFLMSIAITLAFMPSFIRIGDSRISLTFIYIIMCFIVLLFTILKDKTMLSFYRYEARKNKLLFISIFALFLLHLIRFTISPNDGIASRSLISLVVFSTCFFYFSFVFFNDKKLFERFYYLITFGLVLNLIATLLQKNGLQLGSSYEGDRYSGLFSHPNQLGIVISTTFLFYIANIKEQAQLLKKLFAFGMVAVCFFALLMAGSKTNIIVSLVIVTLFFMTPFTRANITTLLSGLIFLAVSLFIIMESDILLHVNPRLFEVLSGLSPDTVSEYRTVVSRMDLWAYSWDIGTSYPYVGEGFISKLFGPTRHSHNIILEYLRIFGPAGVLCIVCFLFALIAYQIKTPHNQQENLRAKVCKLSIYAYILANMMSDSMGPQTVFFLAFFVSYLSVHSRMAISNTQNHLALKPAGHQ